LRWWAKGNVMNSRILSLRRVVVGVLTAAAVVITGTGIQAHAEQGRGTSEPVPVTGAEAASVAAALVSARPDRLFASPEDEFTQLPVITAQGWHYVPYERTYRRLPMIGGDFVVVVDPTGKVSTTSVALTHEVKDVAREPRLTLAEAQKIAAAYEKSPEAGREPEAGGELVVYALGHPSAGMARRPTRSFDLCRCADG
jgi:hypothetical protein